MGNVNLFMRTVFMALLLSSTIASALPTAQWYKGQLTLVNKGVLEGDVSYNWSTEIVSLRQDDGRVRAFSVHQVQQFGWFDHSEHRQRTFMALPASLGNQPEQTFLELCMDGPLSVFRRLRRPHGLFKRAFSHPAYYHDQPSLAQNVDQFDYFVYDAGRLREFNKFYADIYEPLMTTYRQEIQQYVAIHNINQRSLLGRLTMVDHYNYLVQQDPKTASIRAKPYANE